MKKLIVYGTRPEAIKMAPLMQILDCIVVNTGQHRDLTQPIRELFGFSDSYDLKIMKKNQTLDDIVNLSIDGLAKIYKKEAPDLILVHGDTTTAMAAALAAYNNRISIAHVEAGLRTGDKLSPFPEEGNRAIIDSLVDIAFCPTENNLVNINNPLAKKYVVGNTGIDAVMYASKKVGKTSIDEPYIYVTAHRRENHGNPLREIGEALKILAKDIRIIFPVHPNPSVQEAIKDLRRIKNIEILEPLSYLDSVRYMKNAKIILTDSGGIQEEAPALDVPVLCLREKTERQEAVDSGAVKIVGHTTERIVREAQTLLRDEKEHLRMATARNPYGDGTTAIKIKKILESIT